MKKYAALLLAICLCTVLFAACGETPDVTTPKSTLPNETTAPSDGTNISTPADQTEATTGSSVTTAPVGPQILESPNHGFAVRTIEDDNGEIIGVAAFDWRTMNEDTKSISFSSEFVFENKTYPVLKIGVGLGVVKFQSRVESITVAAGIREISDNAFTFCYALTELNLNDGLERIGEMAFWNCNSLESVVIPSTVTEIGEYAFADCVSLKEVTLPRAFEGETDSIFAGCKNITFTFTD